jgi:transcriptional regulator with XRE-family HTH domain
MEDGLISPSLDTLTNLADFFNVPLDYLAGRSDNPERR